MKAKDKLMEHHSAAHKLMGQDKVHKVMHEYKMGKLKSGSGGKVTSRAQAIAIAMHEAGMHKKKK